MRNCVINEYTHVHDIIDDNIILYEPLDFPCDEATIHGDIYTKDEGKDWTVVRFYVDHLQSELVVSDTRIIQTSFCCESRQILIKWVKPPTDHFLAVCYEIKDIDDCTNKSNWLEEGF